MMIPLNLAFSFELNVRAAGSIPFPRIGDKEGKRRTSLVITGLVPVISLRNGTVPH
jgi:hypothetical protein